MFANISLSKANTWSSCKSEQKSTPSYMARGVLTGRGKNVCLFLQTIINSLHMKASMAAVGVGEMFLLTFDVTQLESGKDRI